MEDQLGSEIYFGYMELADQGRYSVEVRNEFGVAESNSATIYVKERGPVGFSEFEFLFDPIPDNDSSGVSFSFHVSDDFEVGDVRIRLGIAHSNFSDLFFELHHLPTGKVVPIPITFDFQQVALEDFNGLLPSGEWRLEVRDLVAEDDGILYYCELEISGHHPPSSNPPIAVQHPRDLEVREGFSTSFSAGAIGARPFRYQWLLNGKAIEGEVESVLNIEETTESDGGSYSVVIQNDFGETLSDEGILSVRRPARLEFYRQDDVLVEIPDNDEGGVALQMEIVDPGEIISLRLGLKLDHTRVDDLEFLLERSSTEGNTSAIVKGSGFDPVTQTFLVVLEAFDQMPAEGSWTLTAKDLSSLDAGILVDWFLEIEYGPVISERPALTLSKSSSTTVLLQWSEVYTGMLLQDSELAAGPWRPLGVQPSLFDGQWRVELPIQDQQRYFRLAQ